MGLKCLLGQLTGYMQLEAGRSVMQMLFLMCCSSCAHIFPIVTKLSYRKFSRVLNELEHV